MKRISFTSHAEEKFERLHELKITKERVIDNIRNPIREVDGYWGRKIAECILTEKLLKRIVYEELEDRILVITIYPCERRRYESKI